MERLKLVSVVIRYKHSNAALVVSVVPIEAHMAPRYRRCGVGSLFLVCLFVPFCVTFCHLQLNVVPYNNK
jgi:hypothetical protein